VSRGVLVPLTPVGESTLAVAAEGSRFAAERRAFNLFSASSLASRSFSWAALYDSAQLLLCVTKTRIVCLTNIVAFSIGRMICMQIGGAIPYNSPRSARLGRIRVA
jgi:hypothetical protein